MRLKTWLCLALTFAIVSCGEPSARAYLAGDASCIGAKIYADDRLIGVFEERTSPATSEKVASAKGLSSGYENVPEIPKSAKRLRVVHPDGRELSVAVPQGPGVELYGGVDFTQMTISLS